MRVFIGIDTSNYTTSCAICDYNGEIIKNYKCLLPVKEGERGLRQSDAVFAHIKNFEKIAELIKEKHANYEIAGIGYSAYPRDVSGSYMPCFLVGKALAEMISALYNIPVFPFSHQAGHIQSAIYSSGYDARERFIAFHVSGGTTEIVLAEQSDTGFNIQLLGGSNDLHAGQAIDRIGVEMGLKFPCGKEIEALALKNTMPLPPINVSVKGFCCNMSGLENLAIKLYKQTEKKELVSSFVLAFISKTLKKLTLNLREKFGNIDIVFAGGVMSNTIIKDELIKLGNVYFAKPEFSTDNAAGISLLARKRYLQGVDNGTTL